MWADMCHSHNIYCNNISIVDDLGNDVVSIGENGFDAGEVDTLNIDKEFELPSGDLAVHEENSLSDIIETQQSPIIDSTSESSSSWLDSFSGGDFFSGGDSSCSSCGGGCGGD